MYLPMRRLYDPFQEVVDYFIVEPNAFIESEETALLDGVGSGPNNDCVS